MTNTYRGKYIAVVGSGHWGKNLVRNFAALGVLHTVCDANSDALTQPQRNYPSIHITTSYDDILNNPEIGAVVLATPAAIHFSMTKEALLAGKDVFVEKPMALEVKGAEELVALADQESRVLMVGHLLRYHPALVKLKEMIDQGELGDIEYVYSNRLNLGKIRREESVVWSFAPHDVSIILHLMDSMPLETSTTGGGRLQPDIADVSVSHLLFRDGVRAHIFVSWLHPYKDQKLVVIGSYKMAVFDDTAPTDKLTLYNRDISLVNGEYIARKFEGQLVPVADTEPLRIECEHFLDCLASRTQPLTDGREGLRVLTVLQACQESLQLNGQPVALDQQCQQEPQRGGTHTSNKGENYFIHETACIDEPSHIGEGTQIWHYSHVMPGAVIGSKCVLGQNTFIGKGVQIGNGVKIQNNVSVYEGVTLEDQVFCGPSSVFTNVINPRSAVSRKSEYRLTLVKKGASLGANCTIICGCAIGRYAFIGAGAVVTKDVPDYALVVGNPARQVGWMCRCGVILALDDLEAECITCGSRYVLRGESLEPTE